MIGQEFNEFGKPVENEVTSKRNNDWFKDHHVEPKKQCLRPVKYYKKTKKDTTLGKCISIPYLKKIRKIAVKRHLGCNTLKA